MTIGVEASFRSSASASYFFLNFILIYSRLSLSSCSFQTEDSFSVHHRFTTSAGQSTPSCLFACVPPLGPARATAPCPRTCWRRCDAPCSRLCRIFHVSSFPSAWTCHCITSDKQFRCMRYQYPLSLVHIQHRTLNNFDNMYSEASAHLDGSTSALTSCSVLNKSSTDSPSATPPPVHFPPCSSLTPARCLFNLGGFVLAFLEGIRCSDSGIEVKGKEGLIQKWTAHAFLSNTSILVHAVTRLPLPSMVLYKHAHRYGKEQQEKTLALLTT